MTRTIPYTDLSTADLQVDAIYEGLAKHGERQLHHHDPFKPLLGVRAQGGFRWLGKIEAAPFMVIYSDFVQLEWPDRIDETTGLVTYFGDNRKPGHELHSLPGNRWLRDAFADAHAGRRARVPPIFVFTKGSSGRDTRFRGLAVPGANQEGLVAIWRSQDQARFQNYRATLIILDVGTVSRAWISSLRAGQPALNEHAPAVWMRWVESGIEQPMLAPPTTRVRSKQQQLPRELKDLRVLEAIHAHFPKESAYEFEKLAKYLVMRMDPKIVALDLTRPWRDGGRDGCGLLRIGPAPGAIDVEFAIEAKCYEPSGKGVGVKDMSRLVSRLRHRQFGVLVTTSYVADQAYKEVVDDNHPVVLLSGADVTELLPAELRSVAAIKPWLQTNYPTPA